MSQKKPATAAKAAPAQEPQTARVEAPTIGRIVHFVRRDALTKRLTERPAIVVAADAEFVNLQIFNDGDGGPLNDALPPVEWQTSLRHSATPAAGTWHWPAETHAPL